MKINKAHWSTNEGQVTLSMPIGKVDVERRMVSGFATLDNIDKQNDIVSTEASVKAFKNFRGNLREMHNPVAVGKVVSFKEDRYFDPETRKFYNGVFVSTYVSKGAQDTWEKVLDGTYSGFSIGGNIKSWDDAYNDEMSKNIRVIKDYELFELSLVDNPANQFANILSIEKVNGSSVYSGEATDIEVENVFWDAEDGIVIVSANDSEKSPSSGNNMQNIGFVEKNYKEDTEMIKFLVDSAKGIKTIKMTKEVNPMTENTELVADEVAADINVEKSEVAPAAVAETQTEDIEKADKPAEEDKVPADMAEMAEEMSEEDEAKAKVTKSEDANAEAIAAISTSLTSAFSDLTLAIKSINDQIADITKSVATVSAEVSNVKGVFNEFGKRVDAIDADTAFRKSGDLGEIVQFEPLEKANQSPWGGRFLKDADLFN